ncbi:sulfite oxidase [Trichonephila clavata]|uniref:sulfite oxidase n=1 Tax=Trichonephila clavata TaxID=2740835 RepID=A0A8X6GAM2_TRICU|nr:sulfite oxidase [Trichonephila clavata]
MTDISVCCCLSTVHQNLFKSSFSQSSFSTASRNNRKTFYSPLFAGACAISSGIILWYIKNKELYASEQKDDILQVAGREIPGLPEYTAEDISKHDSKEKRIWVCFKSGVYDITDFVAKHPGGEKILMAAGASLEPFWELFAVHKNAQVLKMLEEYRIGNLRLEDRGLDIQNLDDPFAADPRRHPVLEPRSVKPFNAEPPKDLLVENFLTPNEVFFVRNHLPVPNVDPEEYELEICGRGIKPIVLKLDDIKTKFKKHTITSVIQCAGNRRSELNEVKKLKAFNSINDVLLAYEMNGKEIPQDHGFPIRVIVPGVVGARRMSSGWVKLFQ